MSSARRLLLAATVCGALSLAGTPRPGVAASVSSGHPPPDMAARLDSYLTGLTRAYQFNGAVLLAQHGTVLLRKGYGMADWSRRIPNTSSTTFILFIEQFAVVAVLQLEDAGKLHEQDHLCTYVPHCPVAWRPITIHEVLDMTSGLYDYINGPVMRSSEGAQSFTIAQLLALIASEPLYYRPGSSCCDEDPSVPVEQYLVEHITGESFGTYLQQHFFGPLELHHSGYFLHFPPRGLQLASGYGQARIPAADKLEGSDQSAIGGIVYTTVSDYYRWEEAVDTGRLLSPIATARILSPAYVPCPRQCGPNWSYGALTDGWEILTLYGHRIVINQVNMNGWYAMDLYYPTQQINLIILGNTAPLPWLTQELALTAHIFG